MLIDQKKTIHIRRCQNGHYDWIKAKYCITCGLVIQKVKDEINIKVCDQCEKEVDTFLPPYPVLFCPYCGVSTGEHMKR